MWEILLTPALTLLGVIVLLLIFGILATLGLIIQRKRYSMQLAKIRAQLNPAVFRSMHDHLQSIIAHEFVKGLHYISTKGEETAQGLDSGQIVLREKQANIVAKSYEMIQHAQNVVGLFALRPNELSKELVRPRQIVEEVIRDLFPYSDALGITVRPELTDPEPIMVNRQFFAQILTNLIHNAIKYSLNGGVVTVKLDALEEFDRKGRAIAIEVTDQGKGIDDKDQAEIFEKLERGDGLIQPGSGLGLNYARTLAHLHWGDVQLVKSRLNQGSTFRFILPYRSA